MQPLNDSFSMSSLADLCGRSGRRRRARRARLQLLQPGTRCPASSPQYVQYDSGNPGYDTDWNNFAPNVGVAWRPNVQDGWLRTLLGDPEQATVRAGFSIAFTRERMDRFTDLYSANPGAAINANRTGNQGNLVLRRRELADAPAASAAASARRRFPTPPGVSADAVARQRRRHQHLRSGDQGADTRSWSVGLQRALSRDMAIEVRYVGTRLHERLDDRELERDQHLRERLPGRVQGGAGEPARARRRRLRRRRRIRARSPIAAPGTGTSPLPTYLAYFSRAPGVAGRRSRPRTPSDATSRNSAWTGHLGEYEPDPLDAAQRPAHQRDVPRQRARRRAAGELLRPQPRRRSGEHHAWTRRATKYDALQIDFRRRLSRGLTVSANYTYAQTYETDLDTVAPRSRLHPRPTTACRTRCKTDVELRGAGRPRPALRRRHEPVAERRSSATGSSRARAGSRCATSASTSIARSSG